MVKLFKKFLRSSRGTIAVMMSVGAPVLFAVTGIAVDYVQMSSIHTSLQGVADSAAIAGAREMPLSNADNTKITAAAKAFVDYEAQKNQRVLTTTTEIKSGESITVKISEKWTPIFAHLLSSGVTPISASATAIVTGGEKICVLGLSKTDSATVSLTGTSKIEANGCAVFSNSTSTTGMVSYKDSLLTSTLSCSSGGIGGGTSNFSPSPVTDCPSVSDPLAARAPPSVGSCDFTNFQVNGEVRTLFPGVYCGGLLISGSSTVTFSPGVYVIKDGSFQVTHTSSVTGDYVEFHLVGDKSTFLFAGNSSVSLSAPKDGPMAGLLFYEDRNAPLNRFHEIVSENARRLIGTIYLPRGNFAVSSKKPVADLSAYTAIVANKIQLNKYPTLVLHSNYHLTDVPVPAALKGFAGTIVLAK